MLNIVPLWFIRYKFFNSLLLGVSVGAIFTLYAPLKPSVYSLGGVLLALGMLLVARLYNHILTVQWFFKISLFVELVMFCAILYFLVASYSYQTALVLYVGYQVTFVFGSYLTRTETLLLPTHKLLTKLDTAKQLGYLTGMGVAYVFYQSLEYVGMKSAQDQVYVLHFILITIEAVVIYLVIKSFKKIP